MSSLRRPLVALGLMSIGLVALAIDGLGAGWTVLGVVAVGCLLLAIAAELVVLNERHVS